MQKLFARPVTVLWAVIRMPGRHSRAGIDFNARPGPSTVVLSHGIDSELQGRPWNLARPATVTASVPLTEGPRLSSRGRGHGHWHGLVTVQGRAGSLIVAAALSGPAAVTARSRHLSQVQVQVTKYGHLPLLGV